MSEYIIERVDSIRFEKTIDGNKAYFRITEPKNFELCNAQTFTTNSLGIKLMPTKTINWKSVFDIDTRIIFSGVIREVKSDGVINIMHSGDFDFIEMCNGRLVQVFEFGKEINNNG